MQIFLLVVKQFPEFLFKNVCVSCVASSVQIGSELDNNESVAQYYLFDVWCVGKSYLRSSNCYLHFCCDGNANCGRPVYTESFRRDGQPR